MASRLGSLARHVVAQRGTAPRADDAAASAVVGPVLSPEDHEMFVREGLCVLRGAIPQDVCAAAVELLEAPGDGEEAVREDGTWRQPTAEDGGADKLLAATLTAPILAAIAELFGDSNAFEFDPCNPANLPAIARRSGDFTRYDDFARPQQQYDGDTPPEQEHIAHIDDNHPSVMPSGWAVGSFIFLTDVPVVGAGAFVTFPGSPARYRVATAESQRCLVEAAPLVGGAAREMFVKAGDVVSTTTSCRHSAGLTQTVAPNRFSCITSWGTAAAPTTCTAHATRSFRGGGLWAGWCPASSPSPRCPRRRRPTQRATSKRTYGLSSASRRSRSRGLPAQRGTPLCVRACWRRALLTGSSTMAERLSWRG